MGVIVGLTNVLPFLQVFQVILVDLKRDNLQVSVLLIILVHLLIVIKYIAGYGICGTICWSTILKTQGIRGGASLRNPGLGAGLTLWLVKLRMKLRMCF